VKLRIAPLASADLDAIWNYIAADSPEAADRVENDLHTAMRLLAEFPGIGHTLPDVDRPGYRFWRVHSYLIAYRVEVTTLIVVRVVHGSRELRAQLRHPS